MLNKKWFLLIIGQATIQKNERKIKKNPHIFALSQQNVEWSTKES